MEKFLFLSEPWADARLGQRCIQVVLQIVVGRRQRKAILSKNSPAHGVVEGLWWLVCFTLEFQEWNKGKKGVACSNILWMTSESFSHDGVLDSCVIWRNETNLGKARCLYIDCHEGSLLN